MHEASTIMDDFGGWGTIRRETKYERPYVPQAAHKQSLVEQALCQFGGSCPNACESEPKT